MTEIVDQMMVASTVKLTKVGDAMTTSAERTKETQVCRLEGQST